MLVMLLVDRLKLKGSELMPASVTVIPHLRSQQAKKLVQKGEAKLTK